MNNTANVINVNEVDFQAEVLNRSRQVPVVVDFWAPWCGPCRMLGPVLEKLAKEYEGGFVLAKVNTDENQRVAMQYGIQGIPAVKGFRDGKVAAEFVGAVPEPQVRAFLQRLGASKGAKSGSAPGEDPRALVSAGSWSAAEAAFRRMSTLEPADMLGLAKALLAQGKPAEVPALLSGITGGPELATAESLKPLVGFLALAPESGGNADLEVRYGEASAQLARGEQRETLESLLAILRRDKRYRDGGVRQVMLAVFALLGDENPLVREYRTKLASVLF